MSNELTNKQLALEELKLLLDIAQGQEELRFKIRGWCIALVTAFSVAFLSEKIKFSGCQFILISSLILVLFLWLDVLYRVAQDRAFKRSKVVEENLRGIGNYSGPLIGEYLSVPNSAKDQVVSLKNIRVYGPYVLLLVIVVSIGIM